MAASSGSLQTLRARLAVEGTAIECAGSLSESVSIFVAVGPGPGLGIEVGHILVPGVVPALAAGTGAETGTGTETVTECLPSQG